MLSQILSIVVLLAFPQSLQAQLLGAVNSVFFAAMPIALAYWGARILGSTIQPSRTVDSPRGTAGQATVGI